MDPDKRKLAGDLLDALKAALQAQPVDVALAVARSALTAYDIFRHGDVVTADEVHAELGKVRQTLLDHDRAIQEAAAKKFGLP